MDLLDEIVAGNSGKLCITKLLALKDHPCLSAQAVTSAIKFIKQGRDVAVYLDHYTSVENLDQEWVDNTNKLNRQDIEKLEEELRLYKSNHIKESIRMAYMDLGDTYCSIGDYSSAVKSFNRAKDYCTSPNHNMEIYMKLLNVYWMTCSWQQLNLQITKAESLLEIPDKIYYIDKLKCYQGIVYISSGKYAQAANVFLTVDYQMVEDLKEIISIRDIATFTTLGALATFNRSDLKAKLVDNNEFRQFLELDPLFSEIILNFYEGKYSECISLLYQMENDWIYKYYFTHHLKEILRLLRVNMILQFLEPFSCSDIKKMAAIFRVSTQEMEKELVGLIESNSINAKIDSIEKTVRKQSEEKIHLKEVSYQFAKKMELESSRLLLRMNLAKNGATVKLDDQLI